jgi:hypothetical protein
MTTSDAIRTRATETTIIAVSALVSLCLGALPSESLSTVSGSSD